MGSFFGGIFMQNLKGSATFRIFSYGAFLFFGIHVLVQWLLENFTGPSGQISSVHDEKPDQKSSKALDAKNIGVGGDEDGFKENTVIR